MWCSLENMPSICLAQVLFSKLKDKGKEGALYGGLLKPTNRVSTSSSPVTSCGLITSCSREREKKGKTLENEKKKTKTLFWGKLVPFRPSLLSRYVALFLSFWDVPPAIIIWHFCFNRKKGASSRKNSSKCSKIFSPLLFVQLWFASEYYGL